MKEATLCRQTEDKKVICLACKLKCIIKEGRAGVCGVRENRDGKLYLLVYGKASAVHTDPIEKKPLYHFLPKTKVFSIGTVGCNFGCTFCQNWNLSQAARELRMKLMKEKRNELLNVEISKYGYDLPPEKIVEICRQQHIPSIAYTYNEPVIFFEYLYDISALAHRHHIKNIFVSNGYESEEALGKIHPYLDAMNIDLKSFSDSFYAKICSARLQPVLDTIKDAHALGIWIEITTLVIPGKNDSEEELNAIAAFIAGIDANIPWHVTAFHPDYKMGDVRATSPATLRKAYDIGKRQGLNFVYAGNIYDAERTTTYCPSCNTTLIERIGYQTTVMPQFANGRCNRCGASIPGVWN